MKRLWIAAAIVIVLAAGTLVNVWYLERFTGNLSGSLEQAQELAENGDLMRALELTRQVQRMFDEKSFYLHVTLSHDDIDNIETIFGEVQECLLLGETDSKYTSANAKLRTQLFLLAEAEQLTLKNIL